MKPVKLWLLVSGLRSRTVTFIASSPVSDTSVGSGQTRIGFQRVVDQDLPDQVLWQAARHSVGALEVPMRIVRREQQHPFAANLFDYGLDLALLVRVVERLDCQADMLANDLRGWAIE